MTLTAQTSQVNSQISTPRLTPLRMIERNRNTDKDDISRLENKIKALESDIVIAKKHGEERRLDKLELSLTNTSIPALDDNSLLDDDIHKENGDDAFDENALQHKELLNKLLASNSAKKPPSTSKNDAANESVLHDDELAILGDFKAEKTVPATALTAVQDVIQEYDEYEK